VKAQARSQNFSVIAAITNSKIIGYQIFQGSITAEDFGAFLSLLLNHNSDILENSSRYAFFMDNARIHKALLLQPFLKNFDIFFNTPYSPFLNIIEEFFGLLKFRFRQKISVNTKNIAEKIALAASEIGRELIFSSYVHTVSFFN